MNKTQKLEDLAAFVIAEAKRRGASDADVHVTVDYESKLGVRLGNTEETQGSGDRSLTLRVFIGQQQATITTSDFRRRQLVKSVRDVIALAAASSADPSAQLPDSKFLATSVPDLNLFCKELTALPAKTKLEMALAAEAAVRAADQRVTNAEANFNDTVYTYVYANSRGFCHGYSLTSCSLVAQAVVTQGDEMKTGYWWQSGRSLANLGDPATIGATAVARAVRQLGARKVASAEVPVVFDQLMAGRLLGQFAGAASGESIYRKASFLQGKLGSKVAADKLNIIDDPFIPGGHGSKPFGKEGLAVSKRTIVRDGALESYFLDAYAARKLDMAPNGGGASNLYIPAGTTSPADIIKSVKSGLYLQSVSGPGYNSVTGDYSLGADGMWIENGELAYPVSEITVASTMQAMLGALEAIASDLEFRSSVSAPTLLIGKMSVAGK